jgi:hypothetical protein
MGVFSFAGGRFSGMGEVCRQLWLHLFTYRPRNPRILAPKQLPEKWVLSPFAGLTNVFWMTILSIVPKFEGFGAMPPAQGGSK